MVAIHLVQAQLCFTEYKMTKPMVRIHNVETDEIIDREMTDDELAKLKQDQEAFQAEKAQAAAKADAKAAAEAKLAALGLTTDDLRALGL